MKKLIALVLALTIILAMLSACGGSSNQKGVVGTWKNKDYGMQVKLYKDGKYAFKIEGSPGQSDTSSNGEYLIVGDMVWLQDSEDTDLIFTFEYFHLGPIKRLEFTYLNKSIYFYK